MYWPEHVTREIYRQAQLDPRIAYGLALTGNDTQSYGGEVELSNDAVNRPIPVTFQQVPANCWIDDFTFDWEMYNYSPGNLLAPLSAGAVAERPGVDLKIQINQGLGPANQVLNQDFQPIQHLVRNAAVPDGKCCDWLVGKYVWAWQSFTMAALLKRTLSEGESPARLTFGLKCKVLPWNPYHMNLQECADGLAGFGITVRPEVLAGLKGR